MEKEQKTYKVIERNSVKMDIPTIISNKVLPIGRGCHVMVPTSWQGDEVEVINKTKSKKV